MKQYFKGWYFKCQSDSQSIAVIPAIHEIGGKRFCSIQVITEEGAWYGRIEELNKQCFGEKGLKLKINIVLRMPMATGREIVGVHSQRNMHGHIVLLKGNMGQ